MRVDSVTMGAESIHIMGRHSMWDTFSHFTVHDCAREKAFDGLCETQLTVSSVTGARARSLNCTAGLYLRLRRGIFPIRCQMTNVGLTEVFASHASLKI